MSESEKEKSPGSLNRRDLLRAAVVGPAAALVQVVPAAASTPSASGETPAAYAPKIFNPHQWKTLHVLSDLIVPADGRSGSATQAGVPEFIDDFLVQEVNEERLAPGIDRKTEVLGGLTWIDMESNRHFGRDFIACTAPQQKQILDRIAYPEKAAAEDHPAAVAFNVIRGLVLDGFFSSKMGVEDLRYQGNKMMPGWEGCPASVTSQLGVDYAEWEHKYRGTAKS